MVEELRSALVLLLACVGGWSLVAWVGKGIGRSR